MVKNRIIYIISLLIGAWLAIMYQSYDTLLAFVVLVSFPFLLLVFFLLMKNKISIQVHVADETVSKREEDGIPIIIDIENRSRIPLTCGRLFVSFQNRYINKKQKEVLQIAAVGKNKTQMIYYLNVDHIGIVDIHVSKVKFYDFFGLWSKKASIEHKIKVTVLPDAVPIDIDADIFQLDEEEESEKYREDIPGTDRGEVFDIKEYADGDQLKNIHWKLSGKKGTLMVKEYSMPLSKKPLIFLNLQKIKNEQGSMDFESLDALLETVMSFSVSLAYEHVVHFLAWADMDEEVTTKHLIEEEEQIIESVQSILESKINNRFCEIEGLFEHSTESEYSRIFYITPFLNEELVNYLYSIKEGMPISILYITEEDEDEQLKELCEDSDIELLIASEADELTSCFQSHVQS